MIQSSTEVLTERWSQQSAAAVLTACLGGFFRARLTFPSEYPLLPPKMRFETPIFHPNSESLSYDPIT